jgi:hypothetical protein
MTLRSKVLGFALLICSCGMGGCPNPTGEADSGTSDAAIPDAPLRPCSSSEACDDGIFCNGEESCVAGACTEGTPLRCNDGIACTSEFCSEETRACVIRAIDEDRDGHAAATCVDARGMALGDDCDDAQASVYPGALELCDSANVDEDCDATTRGGVDVDGDGFEDARCCNGSGATACGTDCNDAVRGANPMAVEVCNLIDDDCDTRIDEGVSVMGFADMDGDGRGNPAAPRTACNDAAQFSVHGDDCDDNNALRSPTLPEVCDGQDNDCVGAGDTGASAALWYLDRDGDGFGSPSETQFLCARPTADVGAYVLLGTDCDDAVAATNPAQAERCDGRDNNCNGLADFVIAPGNLEDDDRDGIADLGCSPVAGTDCDDRDPVSGPGSAEVCDGRDNDCDGMIDDGASSYTFYRDEDGDGFGSAASGVIIACASISGYVRQGNDCSDLNAMRYPGAPELCNGLDDDCNGSADDFPSGVEVCAPSGNVANACVRGRCRASGCTLGHGECDGNPATVCEADTTQPTTCGMGCAVCDLGQTCDGAGCSPRLTRAFMLNASQADIRDIVPMIGAGPGSTDAFVALNLNGRASFGRSGGSPYQVGLPLGGVHGAVLRVGRDGNVVEAFQMTAPGTIVSLARSSTHLYVLGSFTEQSAPFGGVGFVPAPPAGAATTYIATIQLSPWSVTSVATFTGNVVPSDITLAADGTLGIVGTYFGSLTIGSTPLEVATSQRAFIATLPSAGTGRRSDFSSARIIGGSGTFHADAITSLGTEFFVAGNTDGAVDLGDLGVLPATGFCGFVVRFTVAEGVQTGFFYQSGGGFMAERNFRDITATADGDIVVVGDIITPEPFQVDPVRISFPRSLTPASPTFAPDLMAFPSIHRIASRGAEILQAGTVDAAYGTVIPAAPDYAGAIFFGSSTGMSPLASGRVFSVNGPSVPQALAIDPEDGTVWLGGMLNQGGDPPIRVDLTLDGLTVNADPYAGFVFVFTR